MQKRKIFLKSKINNLYMIGSSISSKLLMLLILINNSLGIIDSIFLIFLNSNFDQI